MPKAVSDSDTEPSAEDVAAAPSFEEFVASRSKAMWRSAWLLTGDEHKAEDLVQTALVKVWRHWSRVARDGAIDGYAKRVLVTTYTDWWRRKWRNETPMDTLPEQPADASMELSDVRRDLLRALASLTRGQRAVIVLRYFDDLTESETAAVLGCSVGTVKSQTARAMTALRSSPLLADDHEDDR